jgi:hypothetical protein
MATYVNETTKGRTLHLLRIDNMQDGIVAYLDATKRVKDAERVDQKDGYNHGGPRMGCEVERARQYADYVGQYASADSIHHFYCNDYYLFTDRTG